MVRVGPFVITRRRPVEAAVEAAAHDEQDLRAAVKAAPVEIVRTVSASVPGEPRPANFNFTRAVAEGFTKNEVVWACIRELSQSSGEAILRGQRPDAGPDDDPVPFPSDLNDLLTMPNPAMSMIEWLEAFITIRAICGNVYVLKAPDRLARTAAWYLLRPDRVTIVADRMSGTAAGYIYEIDGEQFPLPPEAVGHHRMFNPGSDLYGLGPLQVLARQVNLDVDATEFARATFENKGVPAGFLKVGRRLEDQDEADEVRRNFHARFTGPANWQRIGVLDVEADYKPIAHNFAELAMEALRDLTESRICSAFGVPPIIVGTNVGLKRSTYSNYETAKESLWEETLLPMYGRIADFLNRLLEGDRRADNFDLKFDFSGVRALQDDETDSANRTKVLAETAGVLIRAGFVPETVVEAVGLPDTLQHSGLLPVTLQGEDDVNDGDGTTVQRLRRALPARLPHPAVRSVNDLDPILTRDLDTFTDAMEAAIDDQFRRDLNRADSVLGREIARQEAEGETFATQAVDDPIPGVNIVATSLLPLESDVALQTQMFPVYRNVAQRAWSAVSEALVFDDALPFSEPEVQHLLNNASDRVRAINETTRNAINETLKKGTDQGLSLRQMADGVKPKPGRPGLKGLRDIVRGLPNARGPAADGQKRARMIARTEVKTMQNQTIAQRYRRHGVGEVFIVDGENDAACAEVNGTRQTVQWFEDNPLSHPNCVRSARPVVEGITDTGGQA
jgi:HK97 family phage portal protein